MLSFDQIIKALKAGEDVKAIDLGYNYIGAEGAKALAHALENNNTVTTIRLESNQIGDEGAKALAHALEKNNTVTTIELRHNKIGDELLNDIRDKLEKNKLQAEALQSKEIEQGVDSVQEQKLEKQEEAHDAALVQLNTRSEMMEHVMLLKLQKMQKLEVAIKVIESFKCSSSIQETPTKYSSGTKTSYHKFKLFLSDANNVNSNNLYKDFEKLLTGDIAHPPEDV